MAAYFAAEYPQQAASRRSSAPPSRVSASRTVVIHLPVGASLLGRQLSGFSARTEVAPPTHCQPLGRALTTTVAPLCIPQNFISLRIFRIPSRFPSLTLKLIAVRFSVHFLPDNRPNFWRLAKRRACSGRSKDGIFHAMSVSPAGLSPLLVRARRCSFSEPRRSSRSASLCVMASSSQLSATSASA